MKLHELSDEARKKALLEVFWGEWSDDILSEELYQDRMPEKAEELIRHYFKYVECFDFYWKGYDEFYLDSLSWRLEDFVKEFPDLKDLPGIDYYDTKCSDIFYSKNYANHSELSFMGEPDRFDIPNECVELDRKIRSKYDEVDNIAREVEAEVLKLLQNWFNNKKQLLFDINFYQDGNIEEGD